MEIEPKIFIGTSGWVYKDWENIFYPPGLDSQGKLSFFSSYFNTAEVNYSFYHLPKPDSYKRWYVATPPAFVFSLKVSRFITHIKRLKGIKKSLVLFLKNAENLKEKLGPLLFQFPPSFKAGEKEEKRLENLLILLKNSNRRAAFEFRHKSWCRNSIFALLRKYKGAFVIADSPSYPKCEAVTSDFVYIRMHGSKLLFSSKYTNKELCSLADKIRKYLNNKLSVFVYFNNDFNGHAVENAKTLINFLK